MGPRSSSVVKSRCSSSNPSSLTGVHHSHLIHHPIKRLFLGQSADWLPMPFSLLGGQTHRPPLVHWKGCLLQGLLLLLCKSQGYNLLEHMLTCKPMENVSCSVGTVSAVTMALCCPVTSGWWLSSLWSLSFSHCLDYFPESLLQSNVTIRFRTRTLQPACLGLTPDSVTSSSCVPISSLQHLHSLALLFVKWEQYLLHKAVVGVKWGNIYKVIKE